MHYSLNVDKRKKDNFICIDISDCENGYDGEFEDGFDEDEFESLLRKTLMCAFNYCLKTKSTKSVKFTFELLISGIRQKENRDFIKEIFNSTIKEFEKNSGIKIDSKIRVYKD